MQTSKVSTMRKLELALSITGAILCLTISVWLWQAISAIQTMWPLPGSYFIELAVLGLIAMFGSLRDYPSVGIIIWAVVGLMVGFVVLGVFSVGFIYLPVAVLFTLTAILSDIRNRQNIALHLGICLIAGMLQAGLMLILIRLP